ncbi:phosphatidylserine decarboxylase [bacterium TMED277]|nr:MAG: phosphatidylserine decarboxylase [bacterium TMED277]
MKNELLLIIKKFFNEIDGLKNFFPPINSAGYPFIIIFIIFSFLLSIFSDFLGWIGVILTIWCVYFFRDPDRVIPKQKNILISPADGKILTVDICKSPKNFSDSENDEMCKVSIFMNVFNVHVNRIPISGKIIWLKYIPGIFLNASLDKASEDNERMIIKIEVSKGKYVYVVQIAGLIARRIKCDLAENQSVEIGDRFGLIRFGSRVDVYFPKSLKPIVVPGQIAIAGETILTEFKLNNSK